MRKPGSSSSRPAAASLASASRRQCHIVVPALRTACERDDGADERVAPSLDVCDVSVAKLAVTKRLADCGHVDSEAPFLNDDVRPDVIDELLLRDELTWALGKINQDVEGPAAKGQHHTLAPQQPFANRKFESAELQFSISSRARHGFKAQHEILAHLRDVIRWAGRLFAPARSELSQFSILETVIFGQNAGDLRPNQSLSPANESLRASLRRGAIIQMSSGFARPTIGQPANIWFMALEGA
jgi:hypothetical protein